MNSRETRRKAREQLQDDRLSKSGIITQYLAQMREKNPDGADALEVDVAELFLSEKGLRVLKLLEKSVLLTDLPLGSSDGALRETNAMRNLVMEIRRIAANGPTVKKTN